MTLLESQLGLGVDGPGSAASTDGRTESSYLAQSSLNTAGLLRRSDGGSTEISLRRVLSEGSIAGIITATGVNPEPIAL